MGNTLNLSDYREVTDLLFPLEVGNDAAVALAAFNTQFGVWGGMTINFDGVRVHKHDPSGLLVRSAAGRVERVWAPRTVSDTQIATWRDCTVAALQPTGTVTASRVLLCAGPIEHRWELPRAGIRLSRAPDVAPRPPYLMADHAAMIRFSVDLCSRPSINGTLANRRLEWWTLVLNVATYLRCAHTVRTRSAWTWNREQDDRSRWLDLEYFFPELVDAAALEAAAARIPEGVFAPDAGYYLGADLARNGAAVLPLSLDETLAAAVSLSSDHKRDLRRACWWIRAADEASHWSTSLAFVALASAVESLAKNWKPQLRPTERFKQFLADMLPCYRSVEPAAAKLYRLRCDLVHEGLVFPDDWIDIPEDDDLCEASAFWSLARVARLAAVNWIRARTALPPVPSKSSTSGQ